MRVEGRLGSEHRTRSGGQTGRRTGRGRQGDREAVPGWIDPVGNFAGQPVYLRATATTATTAYGRADEATGGPAGAPESGTPA
ncbi:hypothetical protein GCM10027605_07330 [Micromonospora zhanjiangensis]